jgi:hypothetical protein
VKLLARESCCREASHARQATRLQKSFQMAFGRWRTGSLHGHSKDHLAYGWPLRWGAQSTCLIDPLDQIQLLSDPHQRSHISDARVPIVRTDAKSAIGGGSADPRRPGVRRDVGEQDPTPIGRRFGTVVRPQRARKTLILSSRHIHEVLSSAKSAPDRRANHFGLELHAQICESRARLARLARWRAQQ